MHSGGVYQRGLLPTWLSNLVLDEVKLHLILVWYAFFCVWTSALLHVCYITYFLCFPKSLLVLAEKQEQCRSLKFWFWFLRTNKMYGNISVLVTFQFWWHFGLGDNSVLVKLQFWWHFKFGYISIFVSLFVFCLFIVFLSPYWFFSLHRFFLLGFGLLLDFCLLDFASFFILPPSLFWSSS